MIDNETHSSPQIQEDSPSNTIREPYQGTAKEQDQRMEQKWRVDSWKNKSALQQPSYADIDALEKELSVISSSPSIVNVEEIKELRSQLEKCELGDSFFIQMGDCSERFDELDGHFIQLKLDAINAASNIFSTILGKDCIKIGRIAGQFAKPRTCEYETFPDGSILPNYRGDIVNSLNERQPNPHLLTQGYIKSAETMNLIRSLQINNSFIHDPLIADETLQNSTQEQETKQSKLFISHEGLLLAYEQCFIREIEGKYYNTGAHLLWIGDRTRQIEGAHIEMFRGIQNPIGLKISSNVNEETLKMLVEKLNPLNEKGKLIVICRFGNKLIEKSLPAIIQAKQKHGLNFTWCCDPMHGNTYSTSSGVKTRNVSDILQELQRFITIISSYSENVGGIHLETSPIEVTECIGLDISESMLQTCYTSSCDPRLNLQQTLYICNQLAQSFEENQKDTLKKKFQVEQGKL